MIDDLPDDLAMLVAAERAARPSPDIHARVRAKLAASAVVVSAATISSTSAAAAGKTVAAGTGLATKLVVVLTLVVGGATAALVLTRDKSSPSGTSPSAPNKSMSREHNVSITPIETPPSVPDPTSPAVTPPPSASIAPTQPMPAPASRDHVRSAEHTRVAPPAAPSESPHALAQNSEAETVAEAWRTLATDPATALVDIDSVKGGTLVEEREAIRCVALARLHRPEASDAITQFLSAHPRSVHRALVESAQKELP